MAAGNSGAELGECARTSPKLFGHSTSRLSTYQRQLQGRAGRKRPPSAERPICVVGTADERDVIALVAKVRVTLRRRNDSVAVASRRRLLGLNGHVQASV